ncbi:hypothetical protein V2154_10990 [Ewingella sp. CoE-038-23]|uniref:hypothetical protein n=1 Tax=Ewingella docleensis TaxID=3118588 RepID=UPI0033656657
MAQYYVYTQIKSNVDSALLYYEMQAHRTGRDGTKLVVLDTGIQPLQSDYKTQRHETIDTTESKSALFILEIMLYRKLGEQFIPLLSKQESSIYSLGQFSSDKVINANSKENIVYMETTQKTKEAKDGETNTYTLKISTKERVFIAPEHPIGDGLDPFSWENIMDQLEKRVRRKTLPNQDRTSLCGPAAFFYCLLKDRPDLYKQMAIELWETGNAKLGALSIKPSHNCRRPKGIFNERGQLNVSGLDWITLASLRDSENSIFDYQSVDDQFSGITLWSGLESWFTKTGYKKVFDNISLSNCSIQDILDLNKYNDGSHHIVTLISAGMLLQTEGDTSFKNHWVVWEGKPTLLGDEELSKMTNIDACIDLRLFSWGEVHDYLKPNITLKEFLKHTFGGMVFKIIN